MTTIAYDGKTLAADSLATVNGLSQRGFQKIRKEGQEFFALGGDSATFQAWIEWWYKGANPKGIPVGPGPSILLIVTAEGVHQVHSETPYADKEGIPLPDGREVHACGSGGEIALGAMMAGATAKEAVEIACMIDVYSGGEVQVIELPWAKESEAA